MKSIHTYNIEWVAQAVGIPRATFSTYQKALPQLTDAFGEKGYSVYQVLSLKVIHHLCTVGRCDLRVVVPCADAIFAHCRAQPLWDYPIEALAVNVDRGVVLALMPNTQITAKIAIGFVLVPVRRFAAELIGDMTQLVQTEAGGRTVFRCEPMANFIAFSIISGLFFVLYLAGQTG